MDNPHWFIHKIFVDDIKLALLGHKDCWAAKVLGILQFLDATPAQGGIDDLVSLHFGC